jgi:hypothetical protein
MRQLRRFCGSGGLAAIGALINEHRGINRGEAAAPTGPPLPQKTLICASVSTAPGIRAVQPEGTYLI